MPVTPTYPGVYIQEIPSGVRTITGVATSITAFVGHTESGPVGRPVRVFNMSEFEANFGQTTREFDLGYALQQFFMNGGTEAVVVRVDTGGNAASVLVKNSTPIDVLRVSAKDPGTAGNSLRFSIDYDSADSTNQFNLTVFRQIPTDPGAPLQFVELQKHRNVSMNSKSTNFVVDELRAASGFLSAERTDEAAAAVAGGQGSSKSGPLSVTDIDALTIATSALSVAVDGQGPFPFSILHTGDSIEGTNAEEKFADLAEKIQTRIREIPNGGAVFSNVTCTAEHVSPDSFLTITSPTTGESSAIRISSAPAGDAAGQLKLGASNGGTETDPASGIRPQQNTPDGDSFKKYFLGQGGDEPGQGEQAKGDNGNVTPPNDPAALIRAIAKLEEVDLFNLLVVPATATLDSVQAKRVIDEGLKICRLKRAFCLVDPPEQLVAPNAKTDDEDLLKFTNSLGREKDAALFYPRLQIPDPASDFRPASFPNAASIAGVMARTDGQRGVWKAPAGTEATIRGITALDATLTDRQNGVLNQVGVNVLRTFPGSGNVVWGARTLDGDDRSASEWKYIPVRRTALFIEESLYRGTQFAVFEPNDEPLWAQLRLNIGAFMQNLFRQGAFQGQTPQQAYLVKVDSETTTQNDINLGIVNIIVGFAPLKPAEFVIISLQQLAGQVAT